MNLNLSAIAVRERAVTLFFILLLAAAGAYAFLMLGRAEDPSFTIKTLTVTTCQRTGIANSNGCRVGACC
jgi:multidrug efflux pump subunit AcrB